MSPRGKRTLGPITRLDITLWLVGGIATIATPILAVNLRRPDDSIHGWILFGQIACALLIALVGAVGAVRTKIAQAREVEVLARSKLAMSDAIDPIVRVCAKRSLATDTRERADMRGQVKGLVMSTAAGMHRPKRARACFFELHDNPKRLIAAGSSGRSGRARTTFDESTHQGRSAISLVESDGELLCEDVYKNPPPGWDPTRERDYETFISVAVVAGDKRYGMLTLDSTSPGDLKKQDLYTLRVMAGLLASALAE